MPICGGESNGFVLVGVGCGEVAGGEGGLAFEMP